MSVQLTVIGASPAWPNPGGAHAGYLVEAGGKLLLECGPGVLSRLRELDALPVDAIAITHLHLDHWGDLVPWIWYDGSGLANPHPPTELWLPPGAAADLDAFGERFGQPAMFEAAFSLREYEARTPFEVAGFELTALPVEHFGLTAFGFVVRGGGRVLAYSGDSAPCPALTELARDADLFLCEATLATSADDSSTRGHLAADEALAVPSRRTLLTHRPVELDVPTGVELAVPGLTTPV